MKKTILILLAAVLFPLSLGAETILLCIGNDAPEMEREDWPVTVSRAFEDGAMDVFFEGGHIVTNAVFTQDEPAPGFEKAGDLAFQNGADAVLMMRLFFPQYATDNLPAPEKVGYALFDYRGSELLSYSEHLLSVQAEAEVNELLDEFTIAAGIIAEEASSRLQAF